MNNNMLITKSRSASWSEAAAILTSGTSVDGHSNNPTYNIARGLLTIYNGSAFLPAFVIDDFCGKYSATTSLVFPRCQESKKIAFL